MEGNRSAVTVWKKENSMGWRGQEECLAEEKWWDTDKDLNRGGWWLCRGEDYSEVTLVRYYSDSFQMCDRAERKMWPDCEMEAERWVKDFGRIKFLKNPTAERPVETDGLSCGRDERKCQNRMKEREAWRWWKLKRGEESGWVWKEGENTRRKVLRMAAFWVHRDVGNWKKSKNVWCDFDFDQTTKLGPALFDKLIKNDFDWACKTSCCVSTYYSRLIITLSPLCILCVCVCASAAAVSEARRSVPHHSQHPDERPKLPLARHFHHPPVSDESLPAASNGEIVVLTREMEVWRHLAGKHIWIWNGEWRIWLKKMRKETKQTIYIFCEEPPKNNKENNNKRRPKCYTHDRIKGDEIIANFKQYTHSQLFLSTSAGRTEEEEEEEERTGNWTVWTPVPSPSRSLRHWWPSSTLWIWPALRGWNALEPPETEPARESLSTVDWWDGQELKNLCLCGWHVLKRKWQSISCSAVSLYLGIFFQVYTFWNLPAKFCLSGDPVRLFSLLLQTKWMNKLMCFTVLLVLTTMTKMESYLVIFWHRQ